MLTGEEQKEVCKMATIAMLGQFDFDRSLARCYVADMSVSNSVIAPGMYDVLGQATGSQTQINVSVAGCLVWKYIMLAISHLYPSVISVLLGII